MLDIVNIVKVDRLGDVVAFKKGEVLVLRKVYEELPELSEELDRLFIDSYSEFRRRQDSAGRRVHALKVKAEVLNELVFPKLLSWGYVYIRDYNKPQIYKEEIPSIKTHKSIDKTFLNSSPIRVNLIDGAPIDIMSENSNLVDSPVNNGSLIVEPVLENREGNLIDDYDNYPADLLDDSKPLKQEKSILEMDFFDGEEDIMDGIVIEDFDTGPNSNFEELIIDDSVLFGSKSEVNLDDASNVDSIMDSLSFAKREV